MRVLRWIGAGLGLALIAGTVWFTQSHWHRIYLPSGTGITAKQICSLVHVSGLEPERAHALYVAPLLGPADSLISWKVTEDGASASAPLGLYAQRAVHREGLGCTLLRQPGKFGFDREATLPVPGAFAPLVLAVDHRDAFFDTDTLEAAFDAAFERPNTLAIAVLHRGALVGERYADAIGPGTPLHGWSMTKSAMTTLFGAMLHRGEIVDGPTRFACGRRTGVPEADISIETHLRMAGGQAIAERNDGTDPNSDMLFTEGDMACFAATREQLHIPGTHWEYMSGNTVMATRALQDALPGEDLQDIALIRERIFEPLGIHSAIIEPDTRGTVQGSSFMYAGTHDWARLAQLYLQDGVWDGERLLPLGFVEKVRTPTYDSGGEYGMGFWLNQFGAAGESFNMQGFQGQYAVILPAHDLVIVRMGATSNADPGVQALVRDVLEAMRDAPV